MSENQARLQLRWKGPIGKPDQYGVADWVCYYELYLPLDDLDIRREGKSGKKVRSGQTLRLGRTKRGSVAVPCRTKDGGYTFDAPYRDGAHAQWDSAKLGGLSYRLHRDGRNGD